MDKHRLYGYVTDFSPIRKTADTGGVNPHLYQRSAETDIFERRKAMRVQSPNALNIIVDIKLFRFY